MNKQLKKQFIKIGGSSLLFMLCIAGTATAVIKHNWTSLVLCVIATCLIGFDIIEQSKQIDMNKLPKF